MLDLLSTMAAIGNQSLSSKQVLLLLPLGFVTQSTNMWWMEEAGLYTINITCTLNKVGYRLQLNWTRIDANLSSWPF